MVTYEEDFDVPHEDFLLLPMRGEEPDSFYDEFGEDAKWSDKAEYQGMADALKEITGKEYVVECDGYRLYAYTDEDAQESGLRECEHAMAKNISKYLHF